MANPSIGRCSKPAFALAAEFQLPVRVLTSISFIPHEIYGGCALGLCGSPNSNVTYWVGIEERTFSRVKFRKFTSTTFAVVRSSGSFPYSTTTKWTFADWQHCRAGFFRF